MSTKPTIQKVTRFTAEFDYSLVKSLDIAICAFYSLYRKDNYADALGGAEELEELSLFHSQLLDIRRGTE